MARNARSSWALIINKLIRRLQIQRSRSRCSPILQATLQQSSLSAQTKCIQSTGSNQVPNKRQQTHRATNSHADSKFQIQLRKSKRRQFSHVSEPIATSTNQSLDHTSNRDATITTAPIKRRYAALAMGSKLFRAQTQSSFAN
jgi:hypothetical protein